MINFNQIIAYLTFDKQILQEVLKKGLILIRMPYLRQLVITRMDILYYRKGYY